MITEDFYTGEPVNTGSPNINHEAEAASMASFGKYDYDPGTRMTMPTTLYPGAYGYNQPYGIGAMPQSYNPVQPTYNQYRTTPYGYTGNPALQMMGYQQQPQYRELPKTIHIPGISMNSEYLPTIDFQERIDKMSSEYIYKQQELEAKSEVDRQSSVYGYGGGYGYNYYGSSWYNPYQYNSLNQEIARSVEAMKEEARENRMSLNLRLSRLSHNIAEDGMPIETIEERYRGRDIPMPQGLVMQPQEQYELNRLQNAVPFDNAQFYRDQWAAVSKKFNDIVPENATMENAFDNIGILCAEFELEEEQHRRRDMSSTYKAGDGGYKYFVKKKAKERYLRERGISLPHSTIPTFDADQARRDFIAQSPVLSKSARLADDGTLDVHIELPCNVGSKTGQNYSVNSNEAAFEEKRQRFASAINSIEGAFGYSNIIQKKIDNFSG